MRLLAMILFGLFVSTHTPVGASLTRTVPRDVGWTQLSAPPGPLGDVRVWLGDRFLVWGRPSALAPRLTAGARRRVRADVLVFGRAARWVRVSPGPLEARSLAVSAWTGSLVVIWGGFGGSGVPVASARLRPARRPVGGAAALAAERAGSRRFSLDRPGTCRVGKHRPIRASSRRRGLQPSYALVEKDR